MIIGKRWRAAVIFTAISVALFSGHISKAVAETNVMLIVDASGSMKKQVDGEPRMTAAKRVLAEALATMPADTRLGLLLYGHRKAKDCSDIELAAPIGAEDAASLVARIEALKPKGETPIAASLELAAKSFNAFKGQNNSIILVTDGIEECQGDPCAAAHAIKESGLDLKVDIVGFTLKDEQKKLVQCIADETGGTYYDAKDAKALGSALQAATKAVVAPDDNILAQDRGGTLIAATNDEWAKLNDGSEDRAVTYDGSGVWGFRDGKTATFDSFDVLIPAQDGYNPKDFELLAGDDGPLGSFRSIGTFATQNIKLMQSPYQKFTFAPVTARYLKVVMKTDHGGGYIAAFEFRLHGKVDDASPSAEPAATHAGIDLLSPANGGNLLAAPNDEWAKLNDGSPDRAVTYAGEGVWGFKDGAPATFDAFEMLIPASDTQNVKDFELLAGDESPTGSFRSIGTFAIANIKMMLAPYQRFTFPPVTARYFKVALKTDQGGGYVAAYDFHLLGQMSTAAISSDSDASTAEAPVQSAAAGTINILAQSNGGLLVSAPNDEWLKLNDGAEERAVTYDGEGVWSFKGDAPATFDTVEMLVQSTDDHNLKDFEILVADDGPAGTFRSVGTFTTQNVKLMQSPYQKFTFAPVTARYLKIVFKTDWGGGYIAADEIRVIGTPAP